MENTALFSRIQKIIPILEWLAQYKVDFLKWDLVAGLTLASYVLPVSMAYATLAGVPPYYGIYCCLAGGLIYALFTSSRHVAIGPTSAISLMVGTTVAVLSGGDPVRWAAIAALTALAAAGIYFIAFAFRLSALVNFISDSILLGFKAGAALSIMSTQLPKLFSIDAGGSDFFTRMWNIFHHLPETNLAVLFFGLATMLLLVLGDKLFPGKPVALFVVILSIIVISVTNLSVFGIHVTGLIPGGLPNIQRPSLRIRDVEGIVELAFACFLMGYIETISAAKTFANKNGYEINPQQELLSLGFANLGAAFFSSYVISGGLSQSTVNEKSGAKTPLSLIICSIALALILLYFTGLLYNLPEVVLAVIVLQAVSGLIKIKELKQIYRLSKVEFGVAMIAIAGVLVFGILKGVIFAVLMSLVLLITRVSRPHIAVLGRIGTTNHYTDMKRHPDNILVPGVLILRIEASILYFNAEYIRNSIYEKLENSNLKLVILDLSSSPYVDVAGSKMLLQLSEKLDSHGIRLKIVEALSNVRDILRLQGLEKTSGKISRMSSIDEEIDEFEMTQPDE